MEERDPSKRSTSPAWKRQVMDTYRHTNRQHNISRSWPSSFLLLYTNRAGSGAVETIRHSDALKQQRLGLRLFPQRPLYTDLDNPPRPLGALRELTHRGSHTITRRLTGKTKPNNKTHNTNRLFRAALRCTRAPPKASFLRTPTSSSSFLSPETLSM